MDLLPNTPWGWVGAVLVLIVGAVAVKIGFTFDINQWQESKRKRLKEKLKANCPCAIPIKEGGRFGFESSFVSPPGTLAYRCWMCGLVTDDMSASGHMLERYLNNPDQYVKQKKAFDKVYKKLYG